MSVQRCLAILWTLTIAAAAAAPAQAHQMNLTNARIMIGTDRSAVVELAIKGSDVDRIAGTKVFDAQTGLVLVDALATAAAPIGRYVAEHAVVLGSDGRRCRPGSPDIKPDEDGVLIRVRWDCAGFADPLVYRSTVLIEIEPNARQVVLIGNGGQSLLDAAQTDVVLTEGGGAGLAAVVMRYAAAGIEHIFIGYDHIAFLIAIVLWARRLWPVVKIVTAFTLAHSLTLSLAALDLVRIPSAIVEPAIAASIVYVAIENFLSRDVEKRWRITFAFGLVHGFGFAGALQEFGLPKSALLPALASFNVGVEIGQITIVSLVLPALLALDRLFVAPGCPRAASMVYAFSGMICALGGYWFLTRTIIA
jgi:hydrogenase/urease accessory protein HupE